MLDESWPLTEIENNQSRRKHLLRAEIKLNYATHNTAQLNQWLTNTEPSLLDDESRYIWHTQQYTDGHTAPLNDWLQAYQPKASSATPFAQLQFSKYQIFLSDHHQKTDLADRLNQHAEMARRLGAYHQMSLSLLQLGELNLQNNDIMGASNVLTRLEIHRQDWWQIHLFRAEVLFANKKISTAITAAQKAKSSATESWDEEAEQRWQSITSKKIN